MHWFNVKNSWSKYFTISFRVLWVSKSEVDKCERHLNKRFNAVKTFPNTRMHHCYIPFDGDKMIMKVTSVSTKKMEIKVSL